MAGRTAAVAVLALVGVLFAGGQSWAVGTGVESTNDDTSAAGAGPEFLGIPVLTLVWAVTGVLAIAVGLVIASRGVLRRAAANSAGLVQATTVQSGTNQDERRR